MPSACIARSFAGPTLVRARLFRNMHEYARQIVDGHRAFSTRWANSPDNHEIWSADQLKYYAGWVGQQNSSRQPLIAELDRNACYATVRGMATSSISIFSTTFVTRPSSVNCMGARRMRELPLEQM